MLTHPNSCISAAVEGKFRVPKDPTIWSFWNKDLGRVLEGLGLLDKEPQEDPRRSGVSSF